MPRQNFPRKVRAAIIERAAGKCEACRAYLKVGEGEPRAKSQNFKWLEEIVASEWPAGCIEWPYAKRANGYGTIFRKGVRTTVNRVVCEMVHGAPPEAGMHAAHECGNRPCVNPAHLSWKTILDNHADKRVHGTHRQGSSVPWSKLTERDVLKIKQGFLLGAGNRDLAAEFNVSHGTISDIRCLRTWRHVP